MKSSAEWPTASKNAAKLYERMAQLIRPKVRRTEPQAADAQRCDLEARRLRTVADLERRVGPIHFADDMPASTAREICGSTIEALKRAGGLARS